jgi:hypothetical protein
VGFPDNALVSRPLVLPVSVPVPVSIFNVDTLIHSRHDADPNVSAGQFVMSDWDCAGMSKDKFRQPNRYKQ